MFTARHDADFQNNSCQVLKSIPAIAWKRYSSKEMLKSGYHTKSTRKNSRALSPLREKSSGVLSVWRYDYRAYQLDAGALQYSAEKQRA